MPRPDYTMGCLEVKANSTVNVTAHHRVLRVMFDLSYRSSVCSAVGYSVACLGSADAPTQTAMEAKV